MTAIFHPDQHLLIEYAAGSLPIAKATMIALHLEHCTHCRQKVHQLEALGGQLLHDIKPEEQDSDLSSAWQNTLSMIQSTPVASPVKRKQSLMQRLFPQGFEHQSWSGVGPVKNAKLNNADPDMSNLSLLRIRAGAKIPVHHHHGEEWTLVLQGGFSDSYGNYHCGDLVVREDHDHHAPVAAANEDCICLTYVENNLKFSGPMGPIYSFISKL